MNFDFIDNIAESVDWRAHWSEESNGKLIAFEFETWTKTAGQNVLVSVVVDATDHTAYWQDVVKTKNV